MGDIYANSLQKKATRTFEIISRFDMETRDALKSLRDVQERLNDLMEHTPDYHFARIEARRNLFWLVILSLGEIGAMFTVFADLFGLDMLKISTEIMRHFLLVLSTAAFTVGFYIASLLIAEHALKGNRRTLWLAALGVLASLTAYFRAAQTMAMEESGASALFLTLMYTAIGFTFPLAAAVFFVRWQETGHMVGLADSTRARLREQETLYTERLKQAEDGRNQANDELIRTTSEYVAKYQEAKSRKDRSRSDWEEHRRRAEAYLAETRLAYDFWTGWRRRSINVPRPAKRLLQITGALLLGIAALFAFAQAANAETAANFAVLCDRSSSASDYSCTPDTVEALGRLWAKKADDSGGGSFELFLIDSGFDTTTLLFSAAYPGRFPGPVMAHKKKWRDDFIAGLTEKAKYLPHSKGSAIVEAIYRSSLRLPQAGETVIYVLSDMREVNEAFNFERRVPSEKEFIGWIDKQSMKPAVGASTRLSICGAHPYTPDNTSTMTTLNYARLLKLWQAVFQEWGVDASLSEVCDFCVK
jgi:hypothetical protein